MSPVWIIVTVYDSIKVLTYALHFLNKYHIINFLQEPSSVEKIMEIDEHIGCAMSGLIADARTLVEHARVETQVLLSLILIILQSIMSISWIDMVLFHILES